MNDAADGGGALTGTTVIDLTRVLGGPYCTQILADHGAEVFKIEPPQGDETRDWGPPFHDDDASYYIGVNRNKLCMGLDLARPAGREVLLRLLARADVLVENFKSGTMERWGIGYAALEPRFPSLVHCRITGFGADGPLGGYPGYDAIVQAMAGMLSVNGEPASGPTRLGIPVVDMGTGLYAATAILMALLERARSGRGQFIDMTLYDSAVALMHPYVANYYLSGNVPHSTGNGHPNLSPYGKFRTRTVEVFIGAGNDRAFERLCTHLGAPALVRDPRFANNRGRVVNRADLDAALAPLLEQADGETLCDALLREGVAAGPVRDAAEVMAHPHTRHRGMAAELDWYRGAGTPIKFSRSRARLERVPPRFGADGREVLRAFGFSEAEIKALAADGVLVERRRRSGAG